MANTNNITLRQITPADVDALREIRLEGLRNHPVAFSADLQVEEARTTEGWQQRINDSAVFLAFDGAMPVGMAGFYRSNSSKTRHQGGIWGVYVRPGYRGRGLAGALVNRCLQWARENGLRMVYIAAAATNTAAIRCYARCGFTAYGLQPMAVQVDGLFYDELLMAQTL